MSDDKKYKWDNAQEKWIPETKASTRKGKAVKRSTITAVGVVLVAIMMITATASLLTYYSQVQTTAHVEQSVLVDGMDYSTAITEEIYATGGCCYCSEHTIENRGCMPVWVPITYSATPDDEGLFVMPAKPLDYTFSGTSEECIGNYYPVDITVEVDGCWVTWTFDFKGDKDLVGDGHFGYGLIVACGDQPMFQIHNNDGTDDTYEWGEHLYSPWGPTIEDGWNGWHSIDMNTPTSELHWVDCTGDRYIAENPDGTFTIAIQQCALCPEIYWAAWFGVGGFYNPNNGYSAYPGGFDWSIPIVDMGIPNY